MRTRRLDVAAIEAAWHGPLTASQVAKAHGSTAGTIKAMWSAAKNAGRLPRTPRPSARGVGRPMKPAPACVLRLVEPVDDEDDDAANDSRNGAPTVFAYGLRSFEFGGDPLLAALEREHGNDRRRDDDDLTELLAARERSHRREIA